MRNEVRALRRVAHLRAFPNFIAYSQYHGQYKKIKVGFIMEHFGDRETGKTTTLLDVIEHRRNAHRRIQDCFPPGCCKVSEKNGDPGGWPPGGGCKGAEPPCIGKFCISELNLRNLVHTFYQHYIENLFIYFQ